MFYDKRNVHFHPLRASQTNRLKCILGTELFEEKKNIDVLYYTLTYTDDIVLVSAII